MPVPTRASLVGALSAERLLDEVESVARIGSYSTDLLAGHWVSSKGLDAIFGIDAGFDRSVEGWVSLVHPADRAMMVAYLTDEVLGRGRPFHKQYRTVRPDSGETRWVQGRGALEFDASGRPVRMLGTIADITDLRVAQAAREASERSFAAIFEGTAEAILIAEAATGRFRWVNPAASAMLGYSRDELLRLTMRDIHPLQDRPQIIEDFHGVKAGQLTVGRAVPCLRKDGTILRADIRASRTEMDGVACVVGFFSDVTEARAQENEHIRLASAVKHTSDGVVIADLEGIIEYVNPAFERMSGYRRDEAVGRNPRFLQSGRQSATKYRQMWRRLTRGQDWIGTLVDRRKDGSLFEIEATMSPIRSSSGTLDGFISVMRDVTALRVTESELDRDDVERAAVMAALARLRPGPSTRETAARICDELVGLSGIDRAAIIHFVDPGQAVIFAAVGPDGIPLATGQLMSANRTAYLYERAAQGPWAEAWLAVPEDGGRGWAMVAAGLRAAAYMPMRTDDVLIGLVVAGTGDEAYGRRLIDRMPAVGEFAAAASALLGVQLGDSHRNDRQREQVQRALAEGGLRPVFQPIVALASSAVVGYEALTRFTDGTPPNLVIADANVIGLGAEIEVACIAAALEAAEALPPDAWLSLNVSPAVLVGSKELAALVAGRSRQIVLEITEHAEIDGYDEVRHAVARLGPTVSVAVDDAGSGFASLRHVVELAPRFVKLDCSIVRHVYLDRSRQAMIAGLVNFAARVGSEVIAEGIEEQAELEMLVELGVTLGQGFLLGIPAPAVAGSASTGRPAPATNVRRRVGERTGAARPSSPRRRVSPALRVG